jgi:hypothetical protein
MGVFGLCYDLQQPRYSLSVIVKSTQLFLVLGGPLSVEPIVKGLGLKKSGLSSQCDHDVF